jgi:hypothetical protein
MKNSFNCNDANAITNWATGFRCRAFNTFKANLVPRACDSREGTRGSGIIRFREESDWPLTWNAQFNLSHDSWLPATKLSQSLTFFPEDRRLGERDCFKASSQPRPQAPTQMHGFVARRKAVGAANQSAWGRGWFTYIYTSSSFEWDAHNADKLLRFTTYFSNSRSLNYNHLLSIKVLGQSRGHHWF